MSFFPKKTIPKRFPTFDKDSIEQKQFAIKSLKSILYFFPKRNSDKLKKNSSILNFKIFLETKKTSEYQVIEIVFQSNLKGTFVEILLFRQNCYRKKKKFNLISNKNEERKLSI